MTRRAVRNAVKAACAAIWATAMLAGGTAGEAAGLVSSAEDVRPMLVGSRVPEVEVLTAEGEAVNLREAVARQPTVLLFYRGDWCRYCNTQLTQILDVQQELAGLGYQVLALSADSPATLSKTVRPDRAAYTVLSDSKLNAARAFGIAFEVDADTIKLYEGYGIDLEAASGETHHGLPVPAAFVVGTDGVVRFSYVNPDYKVRVDPDVLIAAAKAALKQQGK